MGVFPNNLTSENHLRCCFSQTILQKVPNNLRVAVEFAQGVGSFCQRLCLRSQHLCRQRTTQVLFSGHAAVVDGAVGIEKKRMVRSVTGIKDQPERLQPPGRKQRFSQRGCGRDGSSGNSAKTT